MFRLPASQIFSISSETHQTEFAYRAVGKVLEIVKVCPVTNLEVLKAYQAHAKDFEDCLLAMCAESIQCECIVTRNTKDFNEFDIPVFTPEEFLLQNQKADTFNVTIHSYFKTNVYISIS